MQRSKEYFNANLYGYYACIFIERKHNNAWQLSYSHILKMLPAFYYYFFPMYGNLEVNANKIEFERCGIPPLRKVCPLFVLTESNS